MENETHPEKELSEMQEDAPGTVEENKAVEINASQRNERTVTPRKLFLDLPNTAAIKPELWYHQQSSLFVRGMSYYATGVSLGVLAILFHFMSLSIEWILIGSVAAMIIFFITFAVRDSLVQKERKKRLLYREDQVPKLVAIFGEHGYTIPTKSSNELSLSLTSSMTIIDSNETEYKTWDVEIQEGSIQANLIQLNRNSQRDYVRSKSETKQILDEYLRENGEFDSPELQAAFMEGVLRAIISRPSL